MFIFTAIFAFLGRLPWQAYVGLGLILGLLLVYHEGVVNGVAHQRAADAVEIKRVLGLEETARATAEKAFPIVGGLADHSVGGKPCRVPDKFDRDCKSNGVRTR